MIHITKHALGVIGVCRIDRPLILGNKGYIFVLEIYRSYRSGKNSQKFRTQSFERVILVLRDPVLRKDRSCCCFPSAITEALFKLRLNTQNGGA